MEDGYLEGFDVVAFCDNDVNKQGKMIKEVGVISPAKLKEYTFDSIYISSEDTYGEF